MKKMLMICAMVSVSMGVCVLCNAPCIAAGLGSAARLDSVDNHNIAWEVFRGVLKEAEKKFNCVFGCEYYYADSIWTNGCGKSYFRTSGVNIKNLPSRCIVSRWDKYNEKGVLIESKIGKQFEEIVWIDARWKELVEEQKKVQLQKMQELQNAQRARVETWIKKMTDCEIGQEPIKGVELKGSGAQTRQTISLKKKFRYFSECDLVYLEGKLYKLVFSVKFDDKYSQESIYKEEAECFNNLMGDLEFPEERVRWEGADLYIHSEAKDRYVEMEIIDNKIFHAYWDAKRSKGEKLPELDSRKEQ